MIKRIITWALLLLMLLTVGIAVGETAEEANGAETNVAEATGGVVTLSEYPQVLDEVGLQRGTELVVGSVTAMTGAFSTDLWPGSTTDYDVRELIHGYSLVTRTRTQGMTLDGMVISSLETKRNLNGDYVFEITLADHLRFNDGTPITAKDYIFTILLSGSRAIAEIGGMPFGKDHIAGYDSYFHGRVDTLLGVRLISERTFSITITAESMPYFYGIAAINVSPLPMHVIAPGCDVADNGFGTYITAKEGASAVDDPRGFTPGEFGTTMLRATLLDPQTGYVYAPRVTSGPYTLESFDKEANIASFIANPYYSGNYEGQKPHIERVVIKQVYPEMMMDELLSNNVDILHKVANNELIVEGLTRAREGLYQYINYPRSGLVYLSFACEMEPTASLAVRQAINRCIDRSALIDSTVGRVNGIPVYGYYGIGQWMPSSAFEGDIDMEKEELIVQAYLPELQIPYDLSEATRLLEEDGWIFNENGDLFVPGVDEIRYKDEKGELTPLMIKWAKTFDNYAADALEGLLLESFSEVGIGLSVTTLPFLEMLEHYNRQVDREYHMFFLASNFDVLFDPYFTFHIGNEYQGRINTTGIRDYELMEAARQMRVTSVSQNREYVERWQKFQIRFVEVMPLVPLYSNVYFDFYPADLVGFDITDYVSWAEAIQYSYFLDGVR